MSSLPHSDHIHQMNHSHFDHVLAGLQHQKLNHRESINKLEQEREDLEIQRAALVREFQEHAHIHDVSYQNIEGYEDKTYPVESQIEKARHYFWGMAASMLIAVVLGTYFSVSTMLADSAPLLLACSVLVAVGIGVLASVILRALLGASSVRPRASGWLNVTVVAVGVAFFVLLTVFAWLRFQSDSPLAVHLPSLMVGMELTAILFAGACDCGYRMFRWSGVFHERHRHLLQREGKVKDDLANKHVDLMSIEHRIKEHEEAHHHSRHALAHEHTNGRFNTHANGQGHANGHGNNGHSNGHAEVDHEVHHETVHS